MILPEDSNLLNTVSIEKNDNIEIKKSFKDNPLGKLNNNKKNITMNKDLDSVRKDTTTKIKETWWKYLDLLWCINIK